MYLNGEFLCFTLEDPDNNNHQGDSCIPFGTYDCIPHDGPKFKNVWEVTNVPNRGAILIHSGNTINDTHGCILVGKKRGFIQDLPAVLESKAALEELREKLPHTFQLTIGLEV